MEFCEKLDFLMSMTKTTNSMLALQLSLDASYISRLRTGTRKPAKEAGYLRVMAAYFSRRCSEKNLTDNVIDAIRKTSSSCLEGILENAADNPEAAVHAWLNDMEADTGRPIGNFLNHLSSMTVKKPQVLDTARVADIRLYKHADVQIFYGMEGKREAVVEFLEAVIRQSVPCTLLLSSEENMDWLTEKHEYTTKWAYLLQQIIMRGNRIKIIHHLSRNIDEMLMAIGEWLPIYMTGVVEPYYYPKTRDGIFQRTVFVAPGTAAVLSTSVAGKINHTANYLIRDEKAVVAAAAEFGDYLALCRPLLRVFNDKKADELHKTITEYENSIKETFIKTDAMSLLTMPPDAYERACKRSTNDEILHMCRHQREYAENFEAMLRKVRVHEIIKLPDLQLVRDGKCRMNGTVFSHSEGLYYTNELLRAQLENMIRLLECYEKFHVYIDDNTRPDNHMIYLKEDFGVLVMKMTQPSVAFAINESKMTAAFSDYFYSKLGRAIGSTENKSKAIEKLKAVLKSL